MSTTSITAAQRRSSLVPIGGATSDRVGRYPLLFLIPIAILVCAYPALLWLVDGPSIARLLAVTLLFSSFFGLYNGAMIPLLTEIMPPQVRISGFSLAFSLAGVIASRRTRDVPQPGAELR